MLEHIEKVLMSDEVDTIWTLHCNLMAQYGFDRLIYSFLPFRSAPGHDHLGDALVLTNHEPSYLQEFLREDMFMNAPMVKWALENVGFSAWTRELALRDAGKLSQDELRVLDLNARFGIAAGYSIAFADSSARSKGGILLYGEKGLNQAQLDEIWARHGRELQVMNSIVHLKISTMPLIATRRPLTQRQREVLEWVADGKTTADIALIMGLTPATVEKHLRLAREALDVETTAQAVLKATMQKQLFLMSA